MTGGFNPTDLETFYTHFFTPNTNNNKPQFKTTLLSRTLGTDRVVDELHVSFVHSQETPWILPGIPATNRRVEIVVVSIVCVKAGKLVHEHVYWDQASVLFQTGLLDPEKCVSEGLRKKGVRRLPVVGAEAAEAVLSEKGVVNQLGGQVGK